MRPAVRRHCGGRDHRTSRKSWSVPEVPAKADAAFHRTNHHYHQRLLPVSFSVLPFGERNGARRPQLLLFSESTQETYYTLRTPYHRFQALLRRQGNPQIEPSPDRLVG